MTRSTLALLLSLPLLASGSAQATVLQSLDVAELTLSASVIVYGRVVEVRPEWVRGGRQIDSLVTVEAQAYFKGSQGRSVSFVSPGGQIGPYRSITPGAPEFTPGAEVVLFLDTARAAHGLPEVIGLSQGALAVSLDGSGQRRVRIPLLQPGSEPRFPAHVSVTLDELGQQLARILAAGRSGGAVR